MNYSDAERAKIHSGLLWLRAGGYFVPEAEAGRDVWVHTVQRQGYSARDVIAGVELLAGDCLDVRIVPPHLCMYAKKAFDNRRQAEQQAADRAASVKMAAELDAARSAETPEEAEAVAEDMRRQFEAMIAKHANAVRP